MNALPFSRPATSTSADDSARDARLLMRLRELWPALVSDQGADESWAGSHAVAVDVARETVQVQARPGVTLVGHVGHFDARLRARTKRMFVKSEWRYVPLAPYVTVGQLREALAMLSAHERIELRLGNHALLPPAVMETLAPLRFVMADPGAGGAA